MLPVLQCLKKTTEKRKDWSLRSVSYAVLFSHARLFVFVRVSPQRRAKPMLLFGIAQSFQGQGARRGDRSNCRDEEKSEEKRQECEESQVKKRVI
jgi:hypothetical protein